MRFKSWKRRFARELPPAKGASDFFSVSAPAVRGPAKPENGGYPVLQSKRRTSLFGEMAEWLKAHAWKACVPQGTQGSNPCLSAS